MDDLLTTRQLQELLQVDRVTIYRMLEDGRLRGFKVGGQWRFYQRDIDSWLHKQRGRNAEHPPTLGTDRDVADGTSAFPLACIQAVQGIFAEACGTTAITLSADATPITAVSAPGKFCQLLLATPEGQARCLAAWRSLIATRTGAGRLQQCHAGLQYVKEGIKIDGHLSAVLLAGQLRTVSLPLDEWFRDLEDLARDCGVDVMVLRQAAQQIPAHTAQDVDHILKLAKRTADTIAEIAHERTRLLKRLKQIAEMTVLD